MKFFKVVLSFVFPPLIFCMLTGSSQVLAQSTFAGNAQHTGIFTTPAQPLNVIKWQTSIDFHNTGALAHYGSPVISANNTVLVPVKTATDGFRVDAFDGATGTLKYTLPSDYIMPAHNWIPSYNICLVGTRLYFAGAGGTMWHIDNVDSNSPPAPVREVFYTSLSGYTANQTNFNNTIFVNTPITADSAGNIFLGFRVQGTAPAPLATTQSGLARIASNGSGTFVLAGTAANDALIDRDSHNAGPALSNDESSIYFPVKSSTDNFRSYLVELNSTTLATKHSVFLRDPRNNSGARITDDATSNPMVAPDGDVYFGVFGSTPNGSRGFLLRFSSDLSVTKTPAAFGWDYTPGIVPASMVPSYTGTSSYLLFCKYNDYISADGSGINRVAILDPNATQIDPHTTAAGLIEMREVLTVIGPTPDDGGGPSFPFAVQEFCINAPAINPATNSVFFDSEDGHIYRWNLATNSIDQAVVLSAGIGQPYVPSVIGPDGTVYSLNGGNFFAIGTKPNVKVTINSSSSDVRNTVFGDTLTLTATISGTGAIPTGTVTFTDLTYDGLVPVITTLATNIPLDGSGHASVTTSSLAAGGSNFGNHLITATYSGDATHDTSSTTMLQKVHASATTTSLTSSKNETNPGESITFTATVIPAAAIGTPTGMVTFEDGSISIGQVPLNGSGVASLTISTLSSGNHQIKATYASDTRFATSSSQLSQIVGPVVQFLSTNISVNENVGSIQVIVTRSGDPSGISSVDYSTSDNAGSNPCTQITGSASSRCDYIQTLGRLTFAAGETSKSILVPVVDDVFTEGAETFTLSLTNPSGAAMGGNSSTILTINDGGTEPAANPVDDTAFFVRQHYLDFLNREPDPAGFDFWKGNITRCGSDTQCIEVMRVNVSAAFFLSIEFQESGNFVYRLYKGTLGRRPTYSEFVSDRAKIPTADGVPPNKNPLLFDFIRRQEFLTRYPADLFAADFVDALLRTLRNDSGVDLSFLRSELIQEWDACATGIGDPSTCRGPIVQRVVDEAIFRQAVFSESFVLMEYFGYLRRGPNEPPDNNFDGYNFWLTKLNSFNGNFVDAEMVKAFIQSDEYRHRFGP